MWVRSFETIEDLRLWPCSRSSGRTTNSGCWRSTTIGVQPKCDAISTGWTRPRRSDYLQTTVQEPWGATFPAIPSLNKRLVLELARSEYLDRRENVLALGNSGTGKTHLALALGRAACQQGYRVRFTTAAALVNDLLEARDDKRLLRLQKQLAKQDLLIVDELGYVPLSKTTAELLFEIFSQRYEQASTLVTSNLPFNEWTEIFGSERLTGALLDRLTHHVHILELNGDSYRLEHSKKARPHAASPAP